MSKKFLESSYMKIYPVLSHFEKYLYSCVKVLCDCPTNYWGGGLSQFGHCPYFNCFLFCFFVLIAYLTTAKYKLSAAQYIYPVQIFLKTECKLLYTNSFLYSVNSTLHMSHCTLTANSLHTTQCPLTLHIALCTQHAAYSTRDIAHSLHTYCTLHTAHLGPYCRFGARPASLSTPSRQHQRLPLRNRGG